MKKKWSDKVGEIKQKLKTMEVNDVAEHYGVTRKHFLTICNTYRIPVKKAHNRSSADANLYADLSPELIQKRNELLGRVWV